MASAASARIGGAQPAAHDAKAKSVTAERAAAPRRTPVAGGCAGAARVARVLRCTVAATSSPRMARSSLRSRSGVSVCTASCRARTDAGSAGARSQEASVSSPMLVRAGRTRQPARPERGAGGPARERRAWPRRPRRAPRATTARAGRRRRPAMRSGPLPAPARGGPAKSSPRGAQRPPRPAGVGTPAARTPPGALPPSTRDPTPRDRVREPHGRSLLGLDGQILVGPRIGKVGDGPQTTELDTGPHAVQEGRFHDRGEHHALVDDLLDLLEDLRAHARVLLVHLLGEEAVDLRVGVVDIGAAGSGIGVDT